MMLFIWGCRYLLLRPDKVQSILLCFGKNLRVERGCAVFFIMTAH